MLIKKIQIENFRSIQDLRLDLSPTTVFIGQNNAGKTAIMDAVRIVLTRRWGDRGTGFTENDVHRPNPEDDPKSLPPVRITLYFEENRTGEWDQDMVDALEEYITFTPDGRNMMTLRVTCAWDPGKDAFLPNWQFLDSSGVPLPPRRRSLNLVGFFDYVPLFWLGALRDGASEFTAKSRHWGRLLRSVRIPDELEQEVFATLAELDAKVLAADPLLGQIADLVGQATRVAVGETHGGARLNTLPLGTEEMLQRTGIVLRNEDRRPWLSIENHGQGLQSLAVIFLFQAAAAQQLLEMERPGAEPVFAIEEPEAHLHPQAARTLWERIAALRGQRLLTTHSPYFLQHIPLRDIRLVCLRGGRSQVASLPPSIVSPLDWNQDVENWTNGSAEAREIFARDPATGKVAAKRWFDLKAAGRLLKCYKGAPDVAVIAQQARALHRDCRLLPSVEDERSLGFHGRRVRGEVFFARRWLLVEGVCEYLLVHALGKALGWPLDDHGVSVIDFQLSGSAGIYPPLADAFGIPWHMIVDGDPAGLGYRKDILKRGYVEADLTGHFETLTPPHELEDQLLADGHEVRLRQILSSQGAADALTCSLVDLRTKLKKRKTDYMSVLAEQVAADPVLAAQMPAPFVTHITNLRDGVI